VVRKCCHLDFLRGDTIHFFQNSLAIACCSLGMSFDRLAPQSLKEAGVLANRMEKLEGLSFVPYKRCLGFLVKGKWSTALKSAACAGKTVAMRNDTSAYRPECRHRALQLRRILSLRQPPGVIAVLIMVRPKRDT
jgi:hypothetical protein